MDLSGDADWRRRGARDGDGAERDGRDGADDHESPLVVACVSMSALLESLSRGQGDGPWTRSMTRPEILPRGCLGGNEPVTSGDALVAANAGRDSKIR